MLAAGAVALLAWGARSLTTGGAVAAWLVGIAVLVGTGWAGGAVLAAFFVSSSAIGRLAPAPAGLDPKGERRDPWQVAANGGPAALGALLGLHDRRRSDSGSSPGAWPPPPPIPGPPPPAAGAARRRAGCSWAASWRGASAAA